MVDKVFKRVKEANMFNDYAKTVVSQKVDTVKVQRDIAEMLGLKLEENNPVLRANRLSQRLEGKNILIILDDVWEDFDLQALGITLQGGQKRCKNVFTSRTQGLWMEFRSKRRELPLRALPNDESWNLFKEKIGDFLDKKPELVPIAEQIVKECAGLPLALVTLGRALLGKGNHAWKDTLVKLRMVSGVEQKVYESLRLNYDHLGDEEAKSLFLLCSLFREDSDIYLESLVNIVVGLRLFKGINSIEAARDRVFALVEHLQTCCLVSSLNDWGGDFFITVHDVVRDVSKSIALAEKGSLVLEHGVSFENSREQSERCNWISVISNEIRELPSRLLQFPRLELLRCSNRNLQISDTCFEGMEKLQVVAIICTKRIQLSSSLQSITSLRTLCLQNSKLKDFTTIKFLQSLEILRITDKYYIKELPKEIGHLTNLMLLDISGCVRIGKVPPGIISGLTKLEELYLRGLEIDWGKEENAGLKGFELLSNLNILHIMIKDPRMLPRSAQFEKLEKYDILKGFWEPEFFHLSLKYERIVSISDVYCQ